MRLLLVGFSLLMTMTACARVPPPLECVIQNASTNSDSVSHDFPPGFRLTVLFNDPERSSITVGDVFGAQSVLKRRRSEYYANAKSVDGQSAEDLNVYNYAVRREAPYEYESEYLINIVSGQLYHEEKLKNSVQRVVYAHCTNAEL